MNSGTTWTRTKVLINGYLVIKNLWDPGISSFPMKEVKITITIRILNISVIPVEGQVEGSQCYWHPRIVRFTLVFV